MTGTVTVDVSAYQPVVDDSYTREWFSFRICFNGSVDAHAKANLAWAVKARTSGKIKGFHGYVVPLPGGSAAILSSLDQLAWPVDAPVMVDAEKWDGQPYQINGDHSDEFNALAVSLRKRQGDNPDLVWAYGNRGPDLEVWPRKADWLGWVVASYGGSQPVEKSIIGWQYTDGESQYDRPGLPSSTPPFGRCDHNVLFKLPEADMPLSDADIQKIKQAVIEKNGDTVAQVLRDVDHGVQSLAAQLTALAAAVAKAQTQPVDAAAVAKQIIAHLDVTLAAK